MELTINDYSIFYILWNTILGIVPFFLCLLMFRLSAREKVLAKPGLVALFLTWLFFVPNSAYVITGLRHLNGFCPNTMLDTCPEGVWMIMIFFAYGLWGLILFYYSFEQMLVFVKRKVSRNLAKVFPIIFLPVIALGVLLGLLNRFNTWQLIDNAPEIIRSAFYYFSTAEGLGTWAVYSISLIGFYYLSKKLFIPIEKIKFLNKFLK